MNSSSPLLRVGKTLASPKLFFYALFWLMILLTWGTVAQKAIGLYQAQERYFSSWILWLWAIPTPGGRATLTFITMNLLCKLIFASSFHPKKVGILITHLGALCLLGGGVLTAYFMTEGALVVKEGETSWYYQDFHEHELAFVGSKDGVDEVLAFSDESLVTGAVLKHSSLPLQVEVLEMANNIEIIRRQSAATAGEKGMLKNFIFRSLAINPEETKNMAGMRFRLKGLDDEQDGQYMIFEFMEVPQTFSVDGREVRIELRKRIHPLAFGIELLDVERQLHPGTQMPRSFKSEVHVVRPDGSKLKQTISMNRPLRTDGYTLFQTHYDINEKGEETSVLAVVENVGRLFPYISSIIICIGILIHLVLHIPSLIRRG